MFLLDLPDRKATLTRDMWRRSDARVKLPRLSNRVDNQLLRQLKKLLRPTQARGHIRRGGAASVASRCRGEPNYKRSAIMAARAKLAVPAMISAADARPTISPQRLKGTRACGGSLMDCCPLLAGRGPESHRPTIGDSC